MKIGSFGIFRVLIFDIMNFNVWKFHVGTVVTGKLEKEICIYVTETSKTLNNGVKVLVSSFILKVKLRFR